MKNRSPSSDAGRAVSSSSGGAAQAAQEQEEQEQQVRDRAFVIGRPPGHHAGPHG
jgi:acetoin utilization deacetylase AcuC-like enzyme